MKPMLLSGMRTPSRVNKGHLLEVKLLAEPVATVDQDGMFEGYASVFGVPDLGRDIVMPGAFRDSLAVRGAGGIKLLWQHNPAEPLGRWLSITEDKRGLRVRGRLNLSVARARDIHALMKDGAVDGLSIGFRTKQARQGPGARYRRLEAIDLWEISLVTFPMLPQARVTDVKHSSPALAWLMNRLRYLTSLITPAKGPR